MNKSVDDFDVILTHSPYGDERRHPHHIRIYSFLERHYKTQPFGFFSTQIIPNVNMKNILDGILRHNDLHTISIYENGWVAYPYCVQFQGNLTKKLESLKKYKSVDFEKHYNDYGSFSLITESIYMNKPCFDVFNQNVFSRMSKPTKTF